MRLLWYAHFKLSKINWIEHLASRLLSWHHSCLQENIWFHTSLYISQIYKAKAVAKQVHWLFLGYGTLTINIQTHTHSQFTVIYLLNLLSTCSLLRSEKWLIFNSCVCLLGMNAVEDGICNKSCINRSGQRREKNLNVSVSECTFLWCKAIPPELTAQWATNYSRCIILKIFFI